MDRIKYNKKSRHPVYSIMFWAVGILLFLTLLSAHFAGGIFAKYMVGDNYSDSAQVAGTNSQLTLLEHEASLDNGVYKLNNSKEVTGNTYDKVIPGVDIAKDPFIRLEIDSTITYEMYIKVKESEAFPDTVTYELTDDWELIDPVNGVYKYKYVLNTQMNGEIKILKGDKLYVSEHYVGNAQTFTLTFSAWLVQTAIN